MILPILQSRLRHPDYHAALNLHGSAADLTKDLGLCEIDRWSLSCAIEEAHGFEFPGEVPLSWVTVGDVERDFRAATVGKMVGVVA